MSKKERACILTVRMPWEMYAAFRELAFLRRTSMQRLALGLLGEEIRREPLLELYTPPPHRPKDDGDGTNERAFHGGTRDGLAD